MKQDEPVQCQNLQWGNSVSVKRVLIFICRNHAGIRETSLNAYTKHRGPENIEQNLPNS